MAHKKANPPLPRTILARNLQKLIDAHASPGYTPSARAWSVRRGLDHRMIARLLIAENAVTVDKLGEIAHACGFETWQLLLPDFDPLGQPAPAPVSAGDLMVLRKLRRLLGE